ncbi:MAG: MopE-related protein [Myxococcota bacterium]
MRKCFVDLARIGTGVVAGMAAVVLGACGAKTPLDLSKTLADGGTDAPASCDDGCDDGLFCNGSEQCDPATATCLPGTEVACDDDDECTVDTCDESTDSCQNIPTDRDGDGDGATSCTGDCNDSDPTIFPGQAETCDGIDNDCDEQVDEGVLSECGDCRPGCRIVDMPREVPWEPLDGNSAGVDLNPDGELVLSTTRNEFGFAWIANSEDGTLTKLNTRTGAQAGEYDSVLRSAANGAQPPNAFCVTSGPGGNCPSRTAVDLRGSVYVANRAFFNQGTVTKIAGVETDCVDRNGNGTIETSRDLDADGVIERSVPGEYLGQDDECILWTVAVGASNGVPRAIAVAADGTIWVGLHDQQRVVQLRPSDGTVLNEVSLLIRGFNPYGAAIDSRGTLWLTEAGTGQILSVNTATRDVGRVERARSRELCSGSYGIAIDSADRVWVAGFQCTYAFRFDPSTNAWLDVRLPDSGGGRGIAADDRGFIYMAASHEFFDFGAGGVGVGPEITRVTRFRANDGGDIRVFGTPDNPLPGLGSTGVGLDDQRNVWLINQSSGTATKLDPNTGIATEYPVGSGPYTYSDFTGFALRTFTAPNGFLQTVIDGCAMGPTEWEQLRVTADTPPGSSVEVRVRAAPTLEELAEATYLGPFEDNPADLALPPGPIPPFRFLEVELTLVAGNGMQSPSVQDVSVQVNCPI